MAACPGDVRLTRKRTNARVRCNRIRRRREKFSPRCLPSFQISIVIFQSSPTFSHSTAYFATTSCGVALLVLRLTVPISRAADGPNDFTSSVVSFGSVTCSAKPFHNAPIASLPFTIAAPGGNTVASSVFQPQRQVQQHFDAVEVSRPHVAGFSTKPPATAASFRPGGAVARRGYETTAGLGYHLKQSSPSFLMTARESC